jgi:plastocyanin
MMRTKLLAVALLALFGTAAGAAVALPSGGQTAPAAVEAANTASIKIVAQGGTCPVEFCFSPANRTVYQVGTVTWTNVSGVEHTVTRCSIPACPVNGGTGVNPFFNKTALPGASVSVTFHGAGTYNYYCEIHGYLMHGTITVKPFAIATSSLPAGTVGTPYSATLAVHGGKAPITWSIASGSLPKGLSLASTGKISGTPTAKGTSSFTLRAKDASTTPLVATRALSISVS